MKTKISARAKLIAALLRLTTKRKYNVSPERARKQFERELAAGERPYVLPRSVKFKSHVAKSTFEQTDVYTLTGDVQTGKTVFYFHGGGYVHRPRSFHLKFVDKLVQASGAEVIFPLYPLAPFHTYKDMYRVVTGLYADFCARNPDREVIFMGDSAGGGFAISLYEYLLLGGLPTPRKTVAISPWLDLHTDNPDMAAIEPKDPMLVISTARLWAELWSAGDDLDNYLLSPCCFDRTDLLENISIFVGTDDILYPDAVKFFDEIRGNSGCALDVAPRMNHVYPVYPIPEAAAALDKIVQIVKSPT